MERPPFKRKADFADANSRKNVKTDGDQPKPGKKMTMAERYMAKYGHKSGQGLGAKGEGIVAPIEAKLRPQGVGVGAVKEKTAQAKAEEKRRAAARGEEYEDSSEEERQARCRKKQILKEATGNGASTPSGSYCRQKTKFRTVADMEAAADGLHIPNVLKNMIDATGKEHKLLTSAAGLMTNASFAPTAAENIAKRARLELESFVEAWNALKERESFAEIEQEQLMQEIDAAEEEVRKIRGVAEAVEALNALHLNRPSTSEEASQKWDEVTMQLEALQVEHRDDINEFGLQDAAVAVIHPLFKQEMLDWDPLEQPTHLTSHLHRLRFILGISKDELAKKNGYDDFDHPSQRKSTTPFESLIYTLWLPRVRTTITNSWDPHKPSGLLTLVETWRDLLPDFVLHSLLNDLIVKKLTTAVNDWNPRKSSKKRHSQSLPHIWLFPWLQYLSEQHTDPSSKVGLLSDVKRKFRVVLDSWDLSKGVLPGLQHWREVLGSELETALINHLLPRLARFLATEFEVYPPDQVLTPLELVLAWNDFFKPSVMGQLLKTEFFPKWIHVLHQWLTSDPNYEEVGQWFSWWKGQFPSEVNAVPVVKEAWDKGLEMMNLALDLGDDVKTKLPPPAAGPAAPIAPAANPTKNVKETPKKHQQQEETTFKDVVEEWCGQESLLMIPLREAHESTGLPLWRITASATGRGGVLVYLKGDVVWAQNRKDRTRWEPVGLEESLVAKAEGK